MKNAIEQLIGELKEERRKLKEQVDYDEYNQGYGDGRIGTYSDIITRLQQIVDEHSKNQ